MVEVINLRAEVRDFHLENSIGFRFPNGSLSSDGFVFVQGFRRQRSQLIDEGGEEIYAFLNSLNIGHLDCWIMLFICNLYFNYCMYFGLISGTILRHVLGFE